MSNLLQFLQKYLKDVKAVHAGCYVTPASPADDVRVHGLCVLYGGGDDLLKRFHTKSQWPFNTSGAEYWCAAHTGTQHENQQRLTWIANEILRLKTIQFLEEYLEIAMAMANSGDVSKIIKERLRTMRTCGLCMNAETYGGPDVLANLDITTAAPFHDDMHEYMRAKAKETQHLNQTRLDWVRCKLESLYAS